MSVPVVSIVVPVLNAGPHFAGLLTSLSHLDWPRDRLDIIVVDNGSTDGSLDLARQAGVQVLEEPRRGASHARNAGVAAARGEVIAFTDADCIVTTGWIRGLVPAFEDPAVGGVGGRTETFLPTTAAERHAVRTRHLDAERHLAHATFPFAPTANAAFRRPVFDRIGGFDPDFPWGEPIDFCKRVVADGGYRLTYAPRAVVFHRARPTVGGYYRQQQGYGFSQALLCAKYKNEVVWDARRDRSARWEVVRAGLLVPVAAARALLPGRDRGVLESQALEFVRLLGRRRGFRRAVKERRLAFNTGA